MGKPRTSFRYRALRFLCTVLGIVFAAMLVLTLGFQQLSARISPVNPANTVRLTQQELDAFLGVTATGQRSGTGQGLFSLSFDSPATIGGRGSGIVNLLLIGQDRREGEARSRSDSMVLCTFHRDSHKLTMTSFLRDLYVQIPGYHSNRINAAYAAGGMPLLRETFEENFGIHIDGCIEVDFSQFSQLVDLQGGVPIVLRQDEAELLNATVPGASLQEGMQVLSGEEALAYARIRKLDADGDFSRTNRQRKIITAFFDSCRGSDLTDVMALLDKAIPMISTDLKQAKLLALAIELFPQLSGMEIVSQRIPADGTYTDEVIDGMAVLVADMDATRAYLSETLLGKS